MSTYRTQPEETTRMPGGVPYIVGNELAERYSFYGMKGILVIFMTKFLLDAQGHPAPMGEEEAKGWYHLFTAVVYGTPIVGAILSDALWGKYRTIISISIFYCVGHLTLALDDTRFGLALGLGLIAIGAGGIKPCVSAHVGDQFGTKNQHLLERVFGWFYFSINLGAFASMLIGPLLLRDVGSWLAFGVPGVLMVLATLVFWMGRYKFAHIPPAGTSFVRELVSPFGLQILGKLIPIVLFLAMFWALFDQTGSAWVLQGQKLDTNVFGIDIYAEQLQAANPLLVMLLIPVFSYLVYPAIGRFFPLSAIRKIAIGFFVMVPSFLIIAWLEAEIGAGRSPSILWQVLGYIFLTAAEVMVSVTALEFFYTQAPNRMKSFMMAWNMMSVMIGNLFTSGVNFFIQNPDGSSKLAGADYYLFFAGMMAATAVLFVVYAKLYKERRFVQGEDEEREEDPARHIEAVAEGVDRV